MTDSLNALTVTRKTGHERFRHGDEETVHCLIGFWQWACSDLVGNALRGVLAEYIVACALDVDGGTRTQWAAYDLETPDGVRIEVKSSSHLQSWKQSRPSAIGFDVRATARRGDAVDGLPVVRKRQADVYVFCLLNHRDKATLDPLDLSQWTFYVLAARRLDEVMFDQRRVSLASLLRMEPTECLFEGLTEAVGLAAASVGRRIG